MTGIGPNFDAGVVRVGRRRLWPGYVAVLEDPDRLRRAIAELHAFAVRADAPTDRYGVVYRLVSEGEKQAFHYRLQNLLGVKAFADNAAVYNVADCHWHVIDTEHIRHACNRHADPAAEAAHSQIPLIVADFQALPDLMKPGNIKEFGAQVKGTPRVVYRSVCDGGEMTAVEEIRANRGPLTFVTAYKVRLAQPSRK